MSRDKSADADNAFWFEFADRVAECRQAGQMRAIGTRARDEIRTAIEQKRGILALHSRRQGLCAIDRRALIDICETQQHCRHIARLESGGQWADEPDGSASCGVTR